MIKRIIRDQRVLAAMERAGLICRSTDRDAKGRRFAYIESAEQSSFTYKGEPYHTTYIDGCFKPFVVEGHRS